MTTPTALPQEAPGLRDVFTHVWATLITLLSATNKYALAIEATGDIVLDTTTDFRDEERLKSSAKRAVLAQQLAALSAPPQTEA
jgi:hypothetical protein